MRYLRPFRRLSGGALIALFVLALALPAPLMVAGAAPTPTADKDDKGNKKDGKDKKKVNEALTSLGPTRFAGRVRAIAIRPDDPSVIWVASATGGLWVSRDGGASWRQADDFLPTLTFSSLVMDPQNPDVMYAGSGEIFTFIREGTWVRAQDRGAGILKTTDGGTSWKTLPVTAGNPDFFYVSRIAVHPTNSNLVLAATGTGLFRSPDAGASWGRVIPAAATDLPITFLDVKFHPTDPNNAVAAARDQGLFFSTDGQALVWQSSGLPTSLTVGSGSGTRFELAPRRSGTGGWLAAHILRAGGSPITLIRSTDRGANFSLVGSGNPVSCGGQLTNNRLYTGALWVDPTNNLNVVVGGVTLCRSVDGGFTFTSVPGLHNDHHAIVESPNYALNKSVYVGNDGGVYRIDNVGENPNSSLDPPLVVLARNQGLGIQQFHSATMNPLSGVVVGGAQDIGTLRRGPDGVWTELIGGTAGSDGITTATDPGDPDFWYYGKSVGRIFRSTDGGSDASMRQCIAAASGSRLLDMTFDAGCGGTESQFTGDCFNITPIRLDPADPDVLYAGCRRLWRTRQAKAAPGQILWNPILTTTAGHFITTMAIAPSNPQVMWVGTMQGPSTTPGNGREIWRTISLQADSPVWTAMNVSALPARPISRLAVDRSNPNRVFVALTGWADDGLSHNLWRGVRITGSTVQWTDVSTGLPPGPIHSVTVHPTIDGWVYAGTDAGLYVSHDSGTTWSATTRGPARVPVSDLTWADDQRLIIATYGRGVFELDQRPDPELVFPEAVTYLTGFQSAGHVENLLASDDFDLTSARRDFRDSTVRLELTGRTGLPRSNILFIRFDFETSATRPLFFGDAPNLVVELFNFAIGQYVTAYVGSEQATDQTHNAGIVSATADEYISATGELRVRMTWTGVGRATIDKAQWLIDRR